MKLCIDGGSMEITDDNKTMVSQNIANAVKEKYQTPDNKEKDGSVPNMSIIKDSL